MATIDQTRERSLSNARVVDCTIDAYHADTSAISHTGLDEVLQDPALYYRRRILCDLPDDDTEAMAFGRKLHDTLLVPGEFGSGAVLIPRGALNADGHRKGAAWKQFEAENAGKVLLKADEPLWQMIQSAKRHPAARALIEADGHHEHTIFWRHAEHDVNCRARFDFMHLANDIIVDLKTTTKPATPRECANTCATYGYHRQASFYMDGAEAMYGIRPKFVFVFLSKVPPYRVETFELDDDFIEYGREQNDRALRIYAECLRTGRWLPETHGQVRKLSPPGWVRWEKEWSA